VAESEFDAFVTMDQNLRFRQNLRGRKLRIIIVRAVRNTLSILAPLAPPVLAALGEMAPGALRIVSA
jgi:hypothetical protein